ncbi:MAG: hypothetical protein ABW026_14815 [Microvirga sp.]
MTKTITALFHSEQHASDAASHLEQAGVARSAIDIWSTPHNLAPLLEDLGVQRTEAEAYAEGVRRGGSVVIVKDEGAAVDRIITVLDREGVLDLDAEQAAWRAEGRRETAELIAGRAPDEPAHGRVRIHFRRTDRPA